jgi:hypothetical protein
VLSFLFDLVKDWLAGGDPQSRRVRALRRKLLRYLRNAPASAFTGSDAPHVNTSGELAPVSRGRIVDIAKHMDASDVADWEALCARFLERSQVELPGVQIQLPPDEPRMAYAGDKSL